LYRSTIGALVRVVESETAPLASVAMEALGYIGRRTSLPLLIHDSITGSKIDVFFCRKASYLFIVCRDFIRIFISADISFGLQLNEWPYLNKVTCIVGLKGLNYCTRPLISHS